MLNLQFSPRMWPQRLRPADGNSPARASVNTKPARLRPRARLCGRRSALLSAKGCGGLFPVGLYIISLCWKNDSHLSFRKHNRRLCKYSPGPHPFALIREPNADRAAAYADPAVAYFFRTSDRYRNVEIRRLQTGDY